MMSKKAMAIHLFANFSELGFSSLSLTESIRASDGEPQYYITARKDEFPSFALAVDVDENALNMVLAERGAEKKEYAKTYSYGDIETLIKDVMRRA